MRALALPLLTLAALATPCVAQADGPQDQRPIYRVDAIAGTGAGILESFTTWQRAILEKLNRADTTHLPRLRELVVPLQWPEDELAYSPFPGRHPGMAGFAKALVVDQSWQAFAAYERGLLARWGPVSTGRRASPTPAGWFRLNWRSRGRHSTVDPAWFMKWYFNFDNTAGLALHSYALPGYPASHGCIRLLERDAIWLYEWGGEGTPLLVAGRYEYAGRPPWRTPESLARGIELYAAGSMTTLP